MGPEYIPNGATWGTPAPQVDWTLDPYWRQRRLSPAQLQIFDVRLEAWRQDIGDRLEMRETLSSSFFDELRERDSLASRISIDEWTRVRNEQVRFKGLAAEFGWMNCLRSKHAQDVPLVDGLDQHASKCRWIHISSKFTDYLSGCLLGLSDWDKNPSQIMAALRQLEHCVNQQERFSKHGRYFAPFFQYLSEGPSDEKDLDCPMLLSIPFLDWTIHGEPPPLRFQIDPREGYGSSRGTAHLLRSILQHFYRLEDTSDRESHQVFTKHKPWLTDRDLDLKVRRWYGHYPTSLNVDELWILVIDSRHVVTFSSNQSWKARWPPLQVSARIMEVSFRGIRNASINTNEQDYTSSTHIIAALSGALGILHRSFWSDITLCLSDRYASYLGHLQYRLHRSPSTKLVMDLLQVQEELNIVISIMEQQMELIANLQEGLHSPHAHHRHSHISRPYQHRPNGNGNGNGIFTPSGMIPPSDISTYRQVSFSHLSDPAAQLLENLQREYTDLVALRENSNALINRTIQLVNIHLENHNKAILVFTIVTIIFLPLSFISSFFGMNTIDIRNTNAHQNLFWLVAGCVTVGTVTLSFLLAFYGGDMMEWVDTWKDNRKKEMKRREAVKRVVSQRNVSGVRNFEVLDALRPRPRLMGGF